ncbi:hypothetical protein XENOCAPTIV_011178 [Xenoophorus captivus]|uniref:Uncharacterized protein n=1 Tax=Xenoophorus captivus TaxID=1517983 RepID=A0ABV0RRK0_9TELE
MRSVLGRPAHTDVQGAFEGQAENQHKTEGPQERGGAQHKASEEQVPDFSSQVQIHIGFLSQAPLIFVSFSFQWPGPTLYHCQRVLHRADESRADEDITKIQKYLDDGRHVTEEQKTRLSYYCVALLLLRMCLKPSVVEDLKVRTPLLVPVEEPL